MTAVLPIIVRNYRNATPGSYRAITQQIYPHIAYVCVVLLLGALAGFTDGCGRYAHAECSGLHEKAGAHAHSPKRVSHLADTESMAVWAEWRETLGVYACSVMLSKAATLCSEVKHTALGWLALL